MYYIYHIPSYKWKSGKIGKIGCTDDLNYRMKRQHAKTYEILETHSDIFIASDREIELQKQYGYPVDTKPYWKVVKMGSYESRRKGGVTCGKMFVESGRMGELQSLGGKAIGRWAVESGHLNRVSKLAHEKTSKSIMQYDKDGNFINEWKSIRYAGNVLKINQSSITKVCKGKVKTAGGFIFKYKE